MKYDREEWLASLKEGDQVAVSYGGWGRTNFMIERIERITPTRRFTLRTGRKFDNSGHAMGHNDKWSSRPSIRPYDQYVKDQLETEKLSSKVGNLQTSKMTLDQLRRIAAIMDETAD
jgi:carbohydrate-selective porin OprB